MKANQHANSRCRITVYVDRETLTPTSAVPVNKRHRFFFGLALLFLAKNKSAIPENEIRGAALTHLLMVRTRFFSNSSWISTVERALDQAILVTRNGKNNVLRAQGHFDDDESYVIHV